LHFGKKVAFTWPKGLGKGDFEAEFKLFIENAAWRLETAARVLSGSEDSSRAMPIMLAAVKSLQNHAVLTVKMRETGCDLDIQFTGGVSLRVFCNQTRGCQDSDNYTFFTSESVFAVTPGSVVRRRKGNSNHNH